MSKVEIIKCPCGKALAASADGYQSEEWYKNWIKYRSKGCTNELISSDKRLSLL